MTSNSYSQNYKSIFGSSSTTWNVIRHGWCDAIISKEVIATIDTTVDSNTYKVVHGLGGFLREDTILGKVWFYDTSLFKEYLVMDLNLNVGDTFNIYNWQNDSVPIIVDSVYYVSGLKYIRFNEWLQLCGHDEKIIFIEGSGPNASFNYNGEYYATPVVSYMLCHFKDGIKVLSNLLFGDTCFANELGITENKFINGIKVFPNPAADKINIIITDNNYSSVELTFYSTLGILIKKEIVNFQTGQIDISNLKDGLYIISVKNKSVTSNQRLIIQRQ